MYILGLNSAYHDSSVCLLKDNNIIAAVEEERFTRIKHAKVATVDNPHQLPWITIQYVLAKEGILLRDVEAIGYSIQPRKRLKNASSQEQAILDSWGTPEGEERFYQHLLTIPEQLQQKGFKGKFSWLDHHLCHLASTFYPSGFSKAALLSVDGIGETASCAFAFGNEHRMQLLGTIEYPNSLGFLWESISQFLGFTAYDACKIMSLASYGNTETYRSHFQTLVQLTDKGGFIMDNSILRFRADDYCKLEELFAIGKRSNSDVLKAAHFDIAASLQETTNQIMLHMVKYLYEQTQCENLSMAGGVLLNCVTNRLLCEETAFKNIFIQPAAHDAGTALGAAMLLWHTDATRPRSEPMRHAYWGPEFSDEDIERILKKYSLYYRCVSNIEKRVAELLAERNIVGWFQGAMEFGPRALGNRSLLADPRDAGMKEKLNQIVKHRESFRPFAPSVLCEEAPRWFEINNITSASDFMLVAYPIKLALRDQLPAIIHIDGTARIQTVSANTNPRYHQLISEFFQLTGVPVLLNTSFNDSEPIVCSPEDAINTFLKTKIDYLAIGNFLVSRL
ncbi:MAG: carbamoyltransferase C-terminal domain-containing protein [Acidobacteriota bacterium]